MMSNPRILERTNPQNKEFRKISFVENSEFLTYKEGNTNLYNMSEVKRTNAIQRYC